MPANFLLSSQLLKNDNIVNLLDVFRRKGKLYLVFEHVDHTILEDLERCPRGLPDDVARGDTVRKSMWQLLKAINFLHEHNVFPLSFYAYLKGYP